MPIGVETAGCADHHSRTEVTDHFIRRDQPTGCGKALRTGELTRNSSSTAVEEPVCRHNDLARLRKEFLSSQRGGAIASETGCAIDSLPLLHATRRWRQFVGPSFSLLLLIAVAWQFRRLDFPNLRALLPTGAGFWLVFTIYYFMCPATEWIIFRRLWHIPAGGFVALVRKLVSNEIVMGYAGELYFYTWARRNTRITTAPFGAIKDVSILSGLVGNVVTLAMVLIVAPMLGTLHLSMGREPIVGSAIVVLGASLAVLLMRRRNFTLPRRDLWVIAGLHFGRVATTTIVAAVMWHLLLPEVALRWWLLLGTARLLVSRLPLLPNKDVVFAGLASFLVRNDAHIAGAMALIAALILATHLGLGAILGAGELSYRTLGKDRGRNEPFQTGTERPASRTMRARLRTETLPPNIRAGLADGNRRSCRLAPSTSVMSGKL
ncbi:hypothetical protein [Sphingomonas sp. GB1N7]|uniref:hypothetical protein n=1 Tax=Parasphingomonas caseinilytica TaxID=3096158 RepID=UPI002FCC8015